VEILDACLQERSGENALAKLRTLTPRNRAHVDEPPNPGGRKLITEALERLPLVTDADDPESAS